MAHSSKRAAMRKARQQVRQQAVRRDPEARVMAEKNAAAAERYITFGAQGKLGAVEGMKYRIAEMQREGSEVIRLQRRKEAMKTASRQRSRSGRENAPIPVQQDRNALLSGLAAMAAVTSFFSRKGGRGA